MLSITPCISQTAGARALITMADMEQAVTIEQQGRTLIVTGAQGKTMTIYNLIGMPVLSIRIDSNEKRIDISKLPKGIYPVKVGGVTKKVNIN